MDRNDVLKVLAVLRGAYPQFYRGISKQEAEDTVNLWLDRFREEDPRIVAAAVTCLIDGDEKGFPPTIGQVKAHMRILTEKEELTEEDAWNMVSKALRNGLYGSEEEFDRFPPQIKRIVGAPSTLREWAMMDADTVHSVVASNFRRSYKAITQKEREIGKLPAEVRKMLAAAVSGKMKELT